MAAKQSSSPHVESVLKHISNLCNSIHKLIEMIETIETEKNEGVKTVLSELLKINSSLNHENNSPNGRLKKMKLAKALGWIAAKDRISRFNSLLSVQDEISQSTPPKPRKCSGKSCKFISLASSDDDDDLEDGATTSKTAHQTAIQLLASCQFHSSNYLRHAIINDFSASFFTTCCPSVAIAHEEIIEDLASDCVAFEEVLNAEIFAKSERLVEVIVDHWEKAQVSRKRNQTFAGYRPIPNMPDTKRKVEGLPSIVSPDTLSVISDRITTTVRHTHLIGVFQSRAAQFSPY
jgi:hypothetical protein